MSTRQTGESTSTKPLRLWPGVVAALLGLFLMLAVPIIVPNAAMLGMLGAVGAGLVIVVWWLFFSRAPWSERVGAIVVMAVAQVAAKQIVHPSIANAGMGMLMLIFGIPVLSLALVAWAVVSRRFSIGLRRASMVGSILLASGLFTVVRTGGITGAGASDLHWRWTKSPEERLLARAANEAAVPSSAPATARTPDKGPGQAADEPKSPTSASAFTEGPDRGPAAAPGEATAHAVDVERATNEAEWPGFRGPARDSRVRGVQIKTDWAQAPPVEMWRRPIGPGWSSFAVHGDVFYTQEQRGEDEMVAAYKVTTGEPVWRHRDPTRFYESNGGAGPRATPSLSHGRVYTFGATGILNALDSGTGAVVWSRQAASETGVPVPGWGFTSSPLVVDDLVIVAVSGALAAYDLATGKPRWSRKSHGGSYSSPHRTTIDGVRQVLLLSGAGATSVAPSDGTVLWEHAWPGGAIVQPAVTEDGDILINSLSSSGMGGVGTRRIAVSHKAGRWSVAERWTSSGLKPYFNDLVVHKGHAYGFDGSILSCISLEDGQRKWKGGRYGNGQLILLADQDLLLLLSEEGELALVKATPDQFTEVARFPAIEGKTWNHPALVGEVLLVRNGQEMAAFRLSRENHGD